MKRENEPTTLFISRRLFQQLLVDSVRLCYVRNNQVKLRFGEVCNIESVVGRGNIEPSSTCKRFMLSLFTEGPRYMIQNFQDAMTICKHYSYPDLFIMITCNPNWPEIDILLNAKGLNFVDRPDILCRVFKMTLD